MMFYPCDLVILGSGHCHNINTHLYSTGPYSGFSCFMNCQRKSLHLTSEDELVFQYN